jgi:hypothetical protein
LLIAAVGVNTYPLTDHKFRHAATINHLQNAITHQRRLYKSSDVHTSTGKPQQWPQTTPQTPELAFVVVGIEVSAGHLSRDQRSTRRMRRPDHPSPWTLV